MATVRKQIGNNFKRYLRHKAATPLEIAALCVGVATIKYLSDGAIQPMLNTANRMIGSQLGDLGLAEVNYTLGLGAVHLVGAGMGLRFKNKFSVFCGAVVAAMGYAYTYWLDQVLNHKDILNQTLTHYEKGTPHIVTGLVLGAVTVALFKSKRIDSENNLLRK